MPVPHPADRFAIAVRAVFALALAVPLLAGCGGGGGGTGTGGSGAVAPLQSPLRSVQSGDRFSYAVSGTVRATDGSGGSVNLASTSTTEFTSTSMVAGGRGVLKETSAVQVSFGSGDPFRTNGARLFTFDPGLRDQYLVGDYDDSGKQFLLESPVRYAPGTFTTGVQFHESGRFTDGDSADEQFTVDGDEVVSVPAGRFATWRCTRVANGATTTEWYAPQLGVPVKIHAEGPVDGAFTTADFKLSETNVRP